MWRRAVWYSCFLNKRNSAVSSHSRSAMWTSVSYRGDTESERTFCNGEEGDRNGRIAVGSAHFVCDIACHHIQRVELLVARSDGHGCLVCRKAQRCKHCAVGRRVFGDLVLFHMYISEHLTLLMGVLLLLSMPMKPTSRLRRHASRSHRTARTDVYATHS